MFFFFFDFVVHIFQLTITEQTIEKMSNTIEQLNVETTKQKPPTEEIRLEVVQEEDTEEVLKMLKEFFFKVNLIEVVTI